MREVKIGGEARQLGEFSAFKAAVAMEIVTKARETLGLVLEAEADFKRQYERTHFVEVTRAEARREFAPRPLFHDVVPTDAAGEPLRDGDGTIVLKREPVLVDGQPVLGPDPLGHLTEADWAATDHVMRVSESPDKKVLQGARFEAGFRHGRDVILRLLALVVVRNSDIERWDEEDGGGPDRVDAELLREGRELMKKLTLAELLRLGKEALEVLVDETADPFGELVGGLETFAKRVKPEPESREPVAPPMRMESEESTDGSEPSSTTSPPDTAGTTDESSTALAGASSATSESG